MVELADQLLAVDVVAAQREHGAHAGFLEHVESLIDLGLVGVERGQVGDCRDAVFLLIVWAMRAVAVRSEWVP